MPPSKTQPRGARTLFARSIIFVEMAVLVVIALCAGMLLANLNSVDEILAHALQTTGEQRVRSVSQSMRDSVESELGQIAPILSGAGAQGPDLDALQTALQERDGVCSLLYLASADKGTTYVSSESVGEPARAAVCRRYGLSPDALDALVATACSEGTATRSFTSSDSGRSGIVAAIPVQVGSTLVRVHFCTKPSQSAAAKYLEDPCTYYVDVDGNVASGADDGPLADFDFDSLEEHPQTFFLEEGDERFVCTWSVLDNSGMRVVLSYKDPTGYSRASRTAALVLEIAALGLAVVSLVLVAGRRWFLPVRDLEQRSRTFQAELEQKEGLVRQGRLLRAMHGEAPAAGEGSEVTLPLRDGTFVIAAFPGPGAGEEGSLAPEETAIAYCQSRGIMSQSTSYGGFVFLLAQFPAALRGTEEELMRSLQPCLAEQADSGEGPCVCVSAVHTSEEELHLAYLEALEAIEYRAEAQQADEVILYSSLDVQIARHAYRRRLEESELRVREAVGELRLADAADACAGLMQGRDGSDPFSSGRHRLTALKGNLATALCECDSLDVGAETLESWAQAVVACDSVEDLARVLRAQGEELGRIQETCPREERRFQEMLRETRQGYADPQFSATRLAQRYAVSLPTVTRLFRKYRGETFLDCLHGLRIAEAKRLLAQTQLTVTEISEKVGYSSPVTMTRAFKRYEGVTPGAYRDGTPTS